MLSVSQPCPPTALAPGASNLTSSNCHLLLMTTSRLSRLTLSLSAPAAALGFAHIISHHLANASLSSKKVTIFPLRISPCPLETSAHSCSRMVVRFCLTTGRLLCSRRAHSVVVVQ